MRSLMNSGLTILLAASLITFALGIGCGGHKSSNENTSQVPTGLNLSMSEQPTTIDQGRAIYSLATLNSDFGKSSFWGERVADGSLQQISQVQINTSNSDSVRGPRALLGEQGLPQQVMIADNGLLLTIDWSTDIALLKFYQPTGQFVAASSVRIRNNKLEVNQELGPTYSGTFSGNLSGLSAGIVTFTVTGQQNSRSITTIPNPKKVSRSTPTKELEAEVISLQAQVGTSRWTSIARTLIGTVYHELKQTGRSATIDTILTSAFSNLTTGQAFQSQSVAFAKGLVASYDLAQYVATLKAKIDAGQNIVGSGLVNEDTGKTPFAYALTSTITTPRPEGDSTIVSGLAYSRELSTAPVQGSINQNGEFTLNGTSETGEEIKITGAINASQSSFNGSWTRPGNGTTGTVGGTAQAQGGCSVQQNSGGQGSFSEVYNLGQTCGTFTFWYNTYTIPDQIQIYHNNTKIYDSGSVGEEKSIDLTLAAGKDSTIQVIVFAPRDGTAWDYVVGCPDSSRSLPLRSTPREPCCTK